MVKIDLTPQQALDLIIIKFNNDRLLLRFKNYTLIDYIKFWLNEIENNEAFKKIIEKSKHLESLFPHEMVFLVNEHGYKIISQIRKNKIEKLLGNVK